MPGIRAETCYLGFLTGGALHGNKGTSGKAVFISHRGIYCATYYGRVCGVMAAEKGVENKKHRGEKEEKSIIEEVKRP